MTEILIKTAEYVICKKEKKSHWLNLCMKCSYFKYRNVDFTILCGYIDKDIPIYIAKYVICKKMKKKYWLRLCRRCIHFKRENDNHTITCNYESDI